MERIEVESLAGQDNFAIVRLPLRRHPGVLIPGDSLQILCGLAESIAQRASLQDDEELVDEARELLGMLAQRLRHYEAVMSKHQMDLPYQV